eukprot:920021-Amphidinium_carterae.1
MRSLLTLLTIVTTVQSLHLGSCDQLLGLPYTETQRAYERTSPGHSIARRLQGIEGVGHAPASHNVSS